MKKFLSIFSAFCIIVCVLPLSVSAASYSMKKATVKLNYSIYSYTGSQIRPKMTVTYNGKALKKGSDYKVAYENNVDCGTASIKLSGIGKYSGTLKKTFKIRLKSISNLNISALSSGSLKLSWPSVKCDEYYVYRSESPESGYSQVASVNDVSYIDKGLEPFKKYYYQVKAVRHSSSGKNYYTKPVTAERETRLGYPLSFKAATSKDAVTVSWKENQFVDGYQVYRCEDYSWDDAAFVMIKKITDPSATSYTDTSIENGRSYFYKVRAFKNVNGKICYSKFTVIKCSTDKQSILNAAKLKSHKNIPIYNAQGKTTVNSGSLILTDNDIAILKKFAADNFKSGMTREEKLMTTLLWINENTTYARGENWTKIESKSCTDAIFNYKLGQCLQYNGAMASMMAYLGYDVRLIQGYRGTWNTNYWQHFWTEVDIGGITYIMETGNYGQSGYWYYFLAQYSETRGYIKNQKNMNG